LSGENRTVGFASNKTKYQSEQPIIMSEQRATEKIKAQRDELEDLAESDNPASWIAGTLLEAANDA